jgi:hypothetical protein
MGAIELEGLRWRRSAVVDDIATTRLGDGEVSRHRINEGTLIGEAQQDASGNTSAQEDEYCNSRPDETPATHGASHRAHTCTADLARNSGMLTAFACQGNEQRPSESDLRSRSAARKRPVGREQCPECPIPSEI